MASVRASRPIGYWRFERLDGGVVPDELGAHPLRASGDVALAGGDNRFVWFGPDPGDRQLASERFAGLADRDYSIELWVNPDAIREMSLASLVAPHERPGPEWDHLALLELRALEGRFSHAAGAVRYLHRWPPGPVGGVNVFSPQPYRPGLWHHLVGVRQGPTMSLYMDGRLVHTVPIPAARASIPMQLVLGILPTHHEWDRRRFVGALDEVALYDRPLAAEEVAARDRLVRR